MLVSVERASNMPTFLLFSVVFFEVLIIDIVAPFIITKLISVAPWTRLWNYILIVFILESYTNPLKSSYWLHPALHGEKYVSCVCGVHTGVNPYITELHLRNKNKITDTDMY